MKEFLKKYKKILIIILMILLLLAIGAVIYFFVFNQKEESNDSDQNITQQENTTEDTETSREPQYNEVSSSEAVEATYTSAKKWAEDVKLYDCSGLPTSVAYPDISYNFIGAESGKYYRWMCTYYSESEAAIKIFVYEEDIVNDESEPMDIGEDGSLIYGNVDYPTDLTGIVDSELVYASALEQGLNETNYVNMYLMDLSDYGFVWNVEERSKTELDEYSIGAIQNTYIFDIYTGELQDILQKEVY